MNRKLLLIPVIVMLLFASVNIAKGENERIKVVCTLQIFSTIVKEVGGELVSVDYIVPQGTDIHDYSLTQNDIDKINSADLIILASSEFFSIDTKIKDFAKGKIILDFQDYNATLYPLGDIKRNVHGYWLYPQNALNISYAVYLKLSSMLPSSQNYFYENYLSFKKEIKNAEKYILTIAYESDLRNKTALLAVPGVFYVVKSVGMKIAGSIVEGPNKFISPKEISKIEEDIRRGKIDCIVNAKGLENSRAGGIARQISEDTGIKVLYLDIFSADNYTSNLLKNAAILSSADYVDKYSSVSCDYLPYIYVIAVLAIVSLIFGCMAYRYRHELVK